MGLDSGLQVNFPGFLKQYTTNIQMEGGGGQDDKGESREKKRTRAIKHWRHTEREKREKGRKKGKNPQISTI